VPRAAIAARARTIIARTLPAGEDAEAFPVRTGETRHWLQRAGAGLAASGTVTVEAAILGLPLVVVYRLQWLTYRLARRLVRIPFFTMVNLVAGRQVYPEFLQQEVTPDRLCPALAAILPGGDRHEEVKAGMREAVQALRGDGDVCRQAAAAVLDTVREHARGNPHAAPN